MIIDLKSERFREYGPTVSTVVRAYFYVVLLVSASVGPAAQGSQLNQACRALVHQLGGRIAVERGLKVMNRDLEKIQALFTQPTNLAGMDAVLKQTELFLVRVMNDFGILNLRSGVDLAIKTEKFSWKDERGQSFIFDAPYLKFTLSPETAEVAHTTMLTPLMIHQLREVPNLRLVYHPLSLAHRRVEGSFSGILKDTPFPAILFSSADLYSFDMLPTIFLHEMTHLKKRRDLERWQLRGQSRFYPSAIELLLNAQAAQAFDSVYFKGPVRTSVDEAKAFLGTTRVEVMNFRKLVGEGELGAAELQARFQELDANREGLMILNWEYAKILNSFLSESNKNPDSLGFARDQIAGFDVLKLLNYTPGSGEAVEMFLPINLAWGAERDHEFARFYDQLVNNAYRAVPLPPAIRADLISALKTQLRFHIQVNGRLASLYKSAEYRAWAGRFLSNPR